MIHSTILQRCMLIVLLSTSGPLNGATIMGAQCKTILLGASYAAGWNPGTLDGCDLVNKGIGGNETGDMLERFDTDVLAEQPDKLILWGFINDIFRAGPDGMAAVKAEIPRRYVEMIEQARAGGIDVVLATEVTITNPSSFLELVGQFYGWVTGKESYQDQINHHVREVNEELRRLAADRGLLIFDLEQLLSDESGSRRSEYAVEDGSHLNAAAYQAITDAARQSFEPARR